MPFAATLYVTHLLYGSKTCCAVDSSGKNYVPNPSWVTSVGFPASSHSPFPRPPKQVSSSQSVGKDSIGACSLPCAILFECILVVAQPFYWLLTVGSDMLSKFLIGEERGGGSMFALLTLFSPIFPAFMAHAKVHQK